MHECSDSSLLFASSATVAKSRKPWGIAKACRSFSRCVQNIEKKALEHGDEELLHKVRGVDIS